MPYLLRIRFGDAADAETFWEQSLFAWSFERNVAVQKHGRMVKVTSDSREIVSAMICLAMARESLTGFDFKTLESPPQERSTVDG